MKTLREFVIDESIALPPIAEKVNGIFDPEALEAEKVAYANIVALYNASGQTKHKPYMLGRLGVMAVFGPVDGLAILIGLETAANAGSPLSPVLNELLSWMAPGAPGIDIGTESADALLLSLVAATVLTQEQKETLDALRMTPVVVDELQAWNELHTWIVGRPE